jgi:hypothetical protein
MAMQCHAVITGVISESLIFSRLVIALDHNETIEATCLEEMRASRKVCSCIRTDSTTILLNEMQNWKGIYIMS